MTLPAEHVLDLPHLRFGALAWGPEDGRLMLCLHGYPDTAWTWRHLGPVFAERGFRVIAPFMRGYAPTELARDRDYSIGALMHDAIALRDHLGGGTDTVLIGHDWGAIAANGLAAHPHRPFPKIVSMGVPLIAGISRRADTLMPLVRRLPIQLGMSWYTLYQQIPQISERSLGWVLPKLWRDWTPPAYDTSGDLLRVFQSLPDIAHRRAAISYYRPGVWPFGPKPAFPELETLSRTAPRISMLVMHGRIDGAIDPVVGALGTGVLPSGSRHEIIEGAGHFMHLDRPHVVHDLIEHYLES